MSMSLWIFSDREVSSVAEWQAAIAAEGYPLQLSSDMIFEELSGFFPMHLRGELTGFECYREDAADVEQADLGVEIDHNWKFLLVFSWLGSKENELLAAWMAATAYARATNGIIYDGEEGKLLTPAQAHDYVHKLEHPSPETLAAIKEIKERLARKA